MKIGLLLMVAFLVPESARAIGPPSGKPCGCMTMGLLHVNIAPAQSEVVVLGKMVPPVAM